MTNTVIVKPEARDNVYHGSLLPVNFIAGKEYMPPISIPKTTMPNAYAGILFSNDVCLDMLLLVTFLLTRGRVFCAGLVEPIASSVFKFEDFAVS